MERARLVETSEFLTLFCTICGSAHSVLAGRLHSAIADDRNQVIYATRRTGGSWSSKIRIRRLISIIGEGGDGGGRKRAGVRAS